MWRLVLLFTIVPALELFLLLQIGALMGPTPTFLLLLVTGVVGAWLAKREGLQVLGQLSVELQRGLPPGERMMEGALVVIGGLLLITPGVLTDLTGVLLIFPPTRRFVAPRALRWLERRFLGGEGAPLGDDVRVRVGDPPPRPPAGRSPFATPFDD